MQKKLLQTKKTRRKRFTKKDREEQKKELEVMKQLLAQDKQNNSSAIKIRKNIPSKLFNNFSFNIFNIKKHLEDFYNKKTKEKLILKNIIEKAKELKKQGKIIHSPLDILFIGINHKLIKKTARNLFWRNINMRIIIIENDPVKYQETYRNLYKYLGRGFASIAQAQYNSTKDKPVLEISDFHKRKYNIAIINKELSLFEWYIQSELEKNWLQKDSYLDII